MPQVSSVCIRLLGSVQERVIGRVVNLANEVQNAFQFDYQPRRTVIEKKYRLANGTWDLAAAAAKLVKNERSPTIVFSGEPFGDPDNARDRDYLLYWDSLRYYARPDVFVVSTHLWSKLFGEILDPYLLLAMSSTMLEMLTGLGSHHDTRHCLMDECDNPYDLAGVSAEPWLCAECEAYVAQRLGNRLTPLQLGSIRRLRQRAVGRKLCFVAMPFKLSMLPVFKSIQKVLEDSGWTVVREDERTLPRRIVESIYQGIPSSDVVVADLSAENANVYYELGLAHAWNVDTVLLKQGSGPLPFDVHNHRLISYTSSRNGLAKMAKRLAEHAGAGVV